MPTLLIWRGFKFRFYALDVDEPPHVHVDRGGSNAKVWLQPVASLTTSATLAMS